MDELVEKVADIIQSTIVDYLSMHECRDAARAAIAALSTPEFVASVVADFNDEQMARFMSNVTRKAFADYRAKAMEDGNA